MVNHKHTVFIGAVGGKKVEGWCTKPDCPMDDGTCVAYNQARGGPIKVPRPNLIIKASEVSDIDTALHVLGQGLTAVGGVSSLLRGRNTPLDDSETESVSTTLEMVLVDPHEYLLNLRHTLGTDERERAKKNAGSD